MRHDIERGTEGYAKCEAEGELTVQRTERHTQCSADSNSGSGRYFGFFIGLLELVVRLICLTRCRMLSILVKLK